MHVEVLRLGHRLPRDERISTHVALVARAFGANSITYSGQHDSSLEESVKRICENWGGKEFSIKYEKNAIATIKKYKKSGFVVVHLTMYGTPIQQKSSELKTCERVLLVVGSEQVPREVYALADFNIAITNQPHSEVAALAMALDRLFDGKQLENQDFGGKIKVVPSQNSKHVERIG